MTAVAVSPDGRAIASCGRDGSVRLWDREAGQALWRTPLDKPLLAVAFSPEGNRVWTSSAASIHRLDTDTGKISRTLPLERGTRAVAFGVGCSRLAALGEGTVRVHDTWRGKVAARFDAPESGYITFGKSAGEVFLARREDPARIALRQVQNGTIKQSYSGLDGQVVALCLSADGRLLAASRGPVSGASRVVVWETAGGRLVHQFRAPAGWHHGLSFSLDGRLLAAGGGGETNGVQIWDLGSGQEKQRLERLTAAVVATAFTPEGRFLVSGEADGGVKLWKVE